MSHTVDPIVDMRISNTEVELILDRIDAAVADADDADDADDAERLRGQKARRSPRHSLRGLGIIVTIEENGEAVASLQVRVRNISQHGVAFITNRPMVPGTLLWVLMPIGPNKGMQEKEAIVRRWRHVQGMIYEIGVEFGSFDRFGKDKNGDLE